MAADKKYPCHIFLFLEKFFLEIKMIRSDSEYSDYGIYEESKAKKIATIRKGLEKLQFKLNSTKRDGMFYISANVWKERIARPIFIKKTEKTVALIRPSDAVDKAHNSLIISFKGPSPRLYLRTYHAPTKTLKITQQLIERHNFVDFCNIFKNSFKGHNIDLIAPKLNALLIDTVNDIGKLDGQFTDFSEYLYHLFYKGTKVLPIKQLPEIFLPYCRHEDDLNVLIKKFFGYNSKSIKRLFISKIGSDDFHISPLIIAHALRNKTSVDFIRQILESNCSLPLEFWKGKYNFNLFKKFARQYLGKERKLINFLSHDDPCKSDYIGGSNYFIRDGLQNFKILIDDDPKFNLFSLDFKTPREFHDVISRAATKIKNKPFSIYRKELEGIDGHSLPKNIRLVIPKTNHDLFDWANILSNCLSGYSESVKNGKCQIIGVIVNNELTYAIEIVDKKIRQFRGKYNAEAELIHKVSIIKFLEEKDIIWTQDKKDCFDVT